MGVFHDPREERRRHRKILAWSLRLKIYSIRYNNYLNETLTGYRHENDGEKIDALHENKYVKLGKVSLPDAVVNPGAVMIVSVDTMLTQRAVATPWSPNYFTVGAKATRLKRAKQFYEIKLRVLLDNTWVTKPDDTAEEDSCAK